MLIKKYKSKSSYILVRTQIEKCMLQALYPEKNHKVKINNQRQLNDYQ